MVENLAPLCLECHNLTQLAGGFDRKLDAEQVVLFRDDWRARVAVIRESASGHSLSTAPLDPEADLDIELVTTLAEMYRERQDWWPLARLYDQVGNVELRDKYIDLLLQADPTDETLVRARRLQGRLREIPQVLESYLASLKTGPIPDWTHITYLLLEAGRPMESLEIFAQGLNECLGDDNPFTAAYYMARSQGHVAALFAEALRRAAEEDDLWWQVRALQELGWEPPLAQLLEENAHRIKEGDDVMLKRLLAEHQGDREAIRSLTIAIEGDPLAYVKVVEPPEDTAESET